MQEVRRALALATLILSTLGLADPRPELLVFAAASLTESMQNLGKAFEAKTGTKISFSFGGSSDLARQIQSGAPADVFFSADTARMDALEKAGVVKAADRKEFLSNALVVVVPSDSTAKIVSANDLLNLPKIAVADPAAVPVGVYAKKWLTGLALWDKLEPKIIPTLDVRASLAAVESGGVPAAIVYRTDAAIAKKSKVAFVVENGPPILYSVSVVNTAKNPSAARAFVEFFESPAGLEEFKKRGFLVATPKS